MGGYDDDRMVRCRILDMMRRLSGGGVAAARSLSLDVSLSLSLRGGRHARRLIDLDREA